MAIAVVLVYVSFYSVLGASPKDSDTLPLDTNRPPLVDMHTHTTESDGDKTAEEMIQASHSIGMRELWITDHDVIRDLPRVKALQQVAADNDVNLGFGTVECSC